jgi:uncharacterized membrane protein YhaH (DUF805 family)
MKHYINYWKNFYDFQGRSTRTEYWLAILFTFLIVVAIFIFEESQGMLGRDSVYGPISIVWTILNIIPNFAITVRRLHDAGKSGGWVFIP